MLRPSEGNDHSALRWIVSLVGSATLTIVPLVLLNHSPWLTTEWGTLAAFGAIGIGALPLAWLPIKRAQKPMAMIAFVFVVLTVLTGIGMSSPVRKEGKFCREGVARLPGNARH